MRYISNRSLQPYFDYDRIRYIGQVVTKLLTLVLLQRCNNVAFLRRAVRNNVALYCRLQMQLYLVLPCRILILEMERWKSSRVSAHCVEHGQNHSLELSENFEKLSYFFPCHVLNRNVTLLVNAHVHSWTTHNIFTLSTLRLLLHARTKREL